MGRLSDLFVFKFDRVKPTPFAALFWSFALAVHDVANPLLQLKPVERPLFQVTHAVKQQVPPATFEKNIRCVRMVHERGAIASIATHAVLIMKHKPRAELALLPRYAFEWVANPTGAEIARDVQRAIQPLVKKFGTARVRVERGDEFKVEVAARAIEVSLRAWAARLQIIRVALPTQR